MKPAFKSHFLPKCSHPSEANSSLSNKKYSIALEDPKSVNIMTLPVKFEEIVGKST